MKKLLSFIFVLTITTLAACASDEEAKTVDEPKENETKEEKDQTTKEEGTGLEVLEEKGAEGMTEEDWEQVDLSEAQFKKLLVTLTEPNEEGEITLSEAKMSDEQTIILTLNNSGGETMENAMMAPILDAYLREMYKHSDFYNDEEPTIIVEDLSGFKVMNNDEPIDFEEGQTSSSLGTFDMGEKVDVNGTVITLKEASYTDERNDMTDKQPEEVLQIDLKVQNSNDESLFFSGGDFDVYDAEGTQMETYPLDTLMTELKPGKNTSGQAFYGVSGKGPYEVYYTDMMTDIEAKWIIEIE